MKSVVAQLFPRAAGGEPCRLFRSHRADIADGGQRRDFVHVDDCVAMMLWLYARPGVSGIFNIGTEGAELRRACGRGLSRGRPRSARRLCRYARSDPRPLSISHRGAHGAATRLGYDRPMTGLEDGVRDYVQTYLAASDPYR